MTLLYVIFSLYVNVSYMQQKHVIDVVLYDEDDDGDDDDEYYI
jgi:hypothetical protein